MKWIDQLKMGLIVLVTGVSLWYVYPTLKFYRLSEAQRATMPEDRLETLKDKALRLGLDLQGGMHLVLQVDLSKLPPEEAKDAVARVKEVITNRIDQFGVAEPVVQLQGKDRIIVELPGLRDVNRATKLVGQTAQLEFQLLRDNDALRSVLAKIDRTLAKRQASTGGEEAQGEEKTATPPSEGVASSTKGADEGLGQEQPSEGAEDLFEATGDTLARTHPFTGLLHDYRGYIAVSPEEDL